jgi:hypothetical protein
MQRKKFCKMPSWKCLCEEIFLCLLTVGFATICNLGGEIFIAKKTNGRTLLMAFLGSAIICVGSLLLVCLTHIPTRFQQWSVLDTWWWLLVSLIGSGFFATTLGALLVIGGEDAQQFLFHGLMGYLLVAPIGLAGWAVFCCFKWFIRPAVPAGSHPQNAPLYLVVTHPDGDIELGTASK